MSRPYCSTVHDPGVWPYVTRCVLLPEHPGQHYDRRGRAWDAPPVAEGDVVRIIPGSDSGRRYEVVRVDGVDGMVRIAPLAEDDPRDMFWISAERVIRAEVNA